MVFYLVKIGYSAGGKPAILVYVAKEDCKGADTREQVESVAVVNFEMPISLQHYDYTELLEVLEQYKKSMVHMRVGEEGSLLDRKDVETLREMKNRGCSHKLYARSMEDLHDIES